MAWTGPDGVETIVCRQDHTNCLVLRMERLRLASLCPRRRSSDTFIKAVFTAVLHAPPISPPLPAPSLSFPLPPPPPSTSLSPCTRDVHAICTKFFGHRRSELFEWGVRGGSTCGVRITRSFVFCRSHPCGKLSKRYRKRYRRRNLNRNDIESTLFRPPISHWGQETDCRIDRVSTSNRPRFHRHFSLGRCYKN